MFYRTRFLPLIKEEHCLRIVVGSQLDKVNEEGRAVTKEEAQRFTELINSNYAPNYDNEIQCFETSSVTGEGVKEMFEHVFEMCLSKKADLFRVENAKESFKLNGTANKTPAKKNVGAAHRPNIYVYT